MTPKFPHIKVKLVNEDGNAFFIMGRVMTAMKRAKCSKEDIDAYYAEATSGDYGHLLATTMNTVSCDEEE